MTAVLVTGMSGTGKSTVLAELSCRGHRVVDTDDHGWSEEVPAPEGGVEQLWREDRIEALLDRHGDGVLFVSGCVLLQRIGSRTTNQFGKTDEERDRILGDLRAVEPLLRRTATAEIDTRRPVSDVADELESIALAAAASRRAP
jgi:hypothetical protein